MFELTLGLHLYEPTEQIVYDFRTLRTCPQHPESRINLLPGTRNKTICRDHAVNSFTHRLNIKVIQS